MTARDQLEVVPSRTVRFLRLTLRDAEGPFLEIRYHRMPRKERSAMPRGLVAHFVDRLPIIVHGLHSGPPSDFRRFLASVRKPISFKKRIEIVQMRETLPSGSLLWQCPDWILFELRENRREYENLSERSAAKVLNRRLGSALTGRQLAKKEYDHGLSNRKIQSEREYKRVRFDRRDPIKLLPQEWSELRGLKERAERAGRTKLAARANAVLLCASGKSRVSIAALIGVSRPTVLKWIKEWSAFGMESLEPTLNRIRRTSITPTDILVAQSCLKMLAAVGLRIPVETACWEYTEAVRLLQNRYKKSRKEAPVSVLAAVQEFCDRRMRLRHRV